MLWCSVPTLSKYKQRNYLWCTVNTLALSGLSRTNISGLQHKLNSGWCCCFVLGVIQSSTWLSVTVFIFILAKRPWDFTSTRHRWKDVEVEYVVFSTVDTKNLNIYNWKWMIATWQWLLAKNNSNIKYIVCQISTADCIVLTKMWDFCFISMCCLFKKHKSV